MELIAFHVTNYRNIIDSGRIEVDRVTAFVGQNEAGKSNLFDALYRVNPFEQQATYNLDEDWPVVKWGEKPTSEPVRVCRAEFQLTPSEITELYLHAGKNAATAPVESEGASPAPEASALTQQTDSLILVGFGEYNSPSHYLVEGAPGNALDESKVNEWAKKNVPKFVYIHDVELSGHQIELDQLRQRKSQVGWDKLTNDEQTMLIVADLARIKLDEVLTKGTSAQGRTTRAYDMKQASAYLTEQFRELWLQKNVSFDVVVDATTLIILVKDDNVAMPVRLSRRSTGFRWYVSFAWKFTHASKGQYKNCILLLEEPGIHLHYSAQRNLLGVFERLKEANTILYTTHLASMVDLGHPERVRIVEAQGTNAVVKAGVVSSQKAPMAVIEMSLGLAGNMAGLLGTRRTLIVEGGDDALIIHKLSALLRGEHREGLSESIYLWPAQGAPKTPMYAAFAIGQGWDSGVLLDSDAAGNEAKKKIDELMLKPLSKERQQIFRVLQIGPAAKINKTDAAIEDLFGDEGYLEMVNAAYGVAINVSDLPQDGSDMITKRISRVVKSRFGSDLDKGRVAAEMLKRFEKWNATADLPDGTAERAEQLFRIINAAFGASPT